MKYLSTIIPHFNLPRLHSFPTKTLTLSPSLVLLLSHSSRCSPIVTLSRSPPPPPLSPSNRNWSLSSPEVICILGPPLQMIGPCWSSVLELICQWLLGGRDSQWESELCVSVLLFFKDFNPQPLPSQTVFSFSLYLALSGRGRGQVSVQHLEHAILFAVDTPLDFFLLPST